jgi:hypothetical protein
MLTPHVGQFLLRKTEQSFVDKCFEILTVIQ